VSQVPNTSLSAEATYRWPLTAALGGFVHGSAQYTSNRVYPPDITVLPSEATTLVDLRFGVEGKVWGAYVFVDNATNEDRPMDVAFSSNLFAANRPRPRTIGLNVRYDFQ
jgi:hypothetical protein